MVGLLFVLELGMALLVRKCDKGLKKSQDCYFYIYKWGFILVEWIIIVSLRAKNYIYKVEVSTSISKTD